MILSMTSFTIHPRIHTSPRLIVVFASDMPSTIGRGKPAFTYSAQEWEVDSMAVCGMGMSGAYY